MSDVEMVLPYGNDEEKGSQVRRMFDKIARHYDRMNRIMSIGFDKSWRHRGIALLKPYEPKNILDIASGTGDLAIMMQKKLKPDQVTGADLSEEMMAIGRHKAGRAGVADHVTFEYQDCMSLTYPDNSFDAVTAAFGVRNFENLERGLAEMYRVLKPGGHVMILELSTPKWFPMNMFYRIYSSIGIPVLGKLISLDKQAYQYLPASIKAMPQGNEMTALLTKQGFKETSFRTYTGGVCSVYYGVKN
ncbi:MAG: bifunctional demethylmenaquinone methyltransferase/2-methoxy-6-polyprenyl-1,4-benzoquinol methylase UbiE [Tannerella sp.]|jgi:demethylmenaquinone methyltransferase/2-methoxy-6-polyprenyl-1,4-benzoquinol methylase|nr:bifunctional demethylmenaquinone methyltransferase/2-methoxy-6-polyprenyl-1,4-benzoquinol methylase UbiE [Tannerella sp.]